MKIRSLAFALSFALFACAHGPTSIVDKDIHYEHCTPESIPAELPIITPQSPGSTAMAPDAAPKRAKVRRTECGGSWQVVDLVPEGAAVGDPAGLVRTQKYTLRDVRPPFGR